MAATKASLPTGTVTFLFTDIEGSTKLARVFPDAWSMIQARHHALLQTAITHHKGYVFRTIGDELNAAFETPLDALAAALAAQHSFLTEDWGEIGSLRVRMSLHTGPATPGGDDYEGYLTLSHAKRVMSVANGGQILLSETTRALLHDALPQGVSLRDLGSHRLKDFERAEHIFQVIAQGLPDDFPSHLSADVHPNNLPVQPSSIIGRSTEIGEVSQLLTEDRLVTLTGPGGSGKTRLALEVAAKMVEQFQDGVFLVELAPVSDPGLVASTIAQTLGITEAAGQTIQDRLQNYLQSKSILFVLDNFEQVISAAPLVAGLLAAGHGLKVLATSREGLRIRGEREYPVTPLALPDINRLPSPEALAQYPAVELFVQRAQAVKPDFHVTQDTARAVAEICVRLDGLPLAIELAAARIKLLPPQAMLAHLGRLLEFLTGGARDLPARQQTLRNTIAWSFDLLDENEQELFRRLSVFVGGCTIEAAGAVAGDDLTRVSIVDQLGSLLDKSLLREVDGRNGEPRFVILETLREFGLEQLAASGEQEMIRHHHASFFLALAEQAEASLESAEQVQWMDLLETEHDNLRFALEWCRTTEGSQELCLRLAGILGLFWEVHGHFSEGRQRLSAILSMQPADRRTAERARVLARAGELAYRQSDYPATISFAGESLSIYREVEDMRGIASALIKLGNAAMEMGDYAAASEFLEEALTNWRDLEDKHGVARALISLGWTALRSGAYPLAVERLEQALALSRELKDTRSIGFELSGLGEVALRQGDTMQAARLIKESLDLRKQLGSKWGIGVSLGILGWVAICGGKWDRAVVRLGESLEIRREIGDLGGCAWCLERLAEVASAQGQAEKAVRLIGAGAELRASISSVIDPVDLPGYESLIRSLRAELGEAQFEAAWNEGRALNLEQAVAYAFELQSYAQSR